MTPLQLDAWAITFGLALCRVSGLVLVLPLLGEVLPPRLRAAIALIFAAVCASVIGPSTQVQAVSTLVLSAVSEIAVGLSIGYCARVTMAAVEAAGQVAGVQLGLSFAGSVDPLLREEGIVTTRLLSALAWLGFLGAAGLETIVSALVASFNRVPLGATASLDANVLAAWVDDAFSTALRLALPILAGMLVVQTVIALVSRLVAELNPFSFAFSAMTFVGLLLFAGVLVAASRYGAEVPGLFGASLQRLWGGP